MTLTQCICSFQLKCTGYSFITLYTGRSLCCYYKATYVLRSYSYLVDGFKCFTVNIVEAPQEYLVTKVNLFMINYNLIQRTSLPLPDQFQLSQPFIYSTPMGSFRSWAWMTILMGLRVAGIAFPHLKLNWT